VFSFEALDGIKASNFPANQVS